MDSQDKTLTEKTDQPPDLLPDETTIKVVHKKTGKVSYIIIDKVNEEMLNQYTWHISDKGYARTTFLDVNKKQCKISMHRMLLPGKMIGHIDRNKLNNTMKNLRVTTPKLNSLNRSRNIIATNRYRGVSFHKRHKTFQVTVDRKHIGWCNDELSAAYAYNEYVLENFPNDAYLLKNLNDVAKPDNYKFNKTKTKQDSDLPKGVSFCKKRNIYVLRITFQQEKLKKRVYSKSREEAIKKYNEIVDDLEQKWESKMNALPITRNVDNIAVIRTSKWQSNMCDQDKKSQEILVDDEDWHRLMKMGKWQICKKGYVLGSKGKMHRIIMNCTENDEENNVDHIDINKQNNQKINLRIKPKKDPLHAHNRKKQNGTSSKYTGVCYIKASKKWQTNITHIGKKTTKTFDTEEEAARFYDQKATEFYGDNAKLNFSTNKTLLQKRIFGQIESEIETTNKRSKHS